MGDRSPKDKQKKKQQIEKDHNQKQQHKQENMAKNRHSTGVPGSDQGDLKKAG